VKSDQGTVALDSPSTCIVVFTRSMHKGFLAFGTYRWVLVSLFQAASAPYGFNSWTPGSAAGEHVLSNSSITDVFVDGQRISGTTYSLVDIEF
jgi:hypothetical protein